MPNQFVALCTVGSLGSLTTDTPGRENSRTYVSAGSIESQARFVVASRLQLWENEQSTTRISTGGCERDLKPKWKGRRGP